MDAAGMFDRHVGETGPPGDQPANQRCRKQPVGTDDVRVGGKPPRPMEKRPMKGRKFEPGGGSRRQYPPKVRIGGEEWRARPVREAFDPDTVPDSRAARRPGRRQNRYLRER